jgi:ribosomal-protein-alanine acetyltransferase
MSRKSENKRAEFVVMWEFRVGPGKRRAFEKAYEPDGVWSMLFRGSEGYIRTELVRDREEPRRYVTIDIWRSREDYQQFKTKNRAKYEAMDQQCENLTTSEKLIGEFLRIALANGRPSAKSELLQSSPGEDQESSASYSIGPATAADVPQIIAMEREIPSAAHWPQSAYLAIFDQSSPTRIALLASEEESACGIYGFAIARVAAGECELENIFVAAKAQGHGLASRLVQSLAEAARNQNARRIFLEVRESNAVARSLYEKCGFVITGRRLSYYDNPIEDAVLYTLQL